MDKAQIARMIDHTILKAEATEKEVLKLCKEAVEYNFASVCINPSMVPVAATALEGTDVEVCTVIGFPLGATTTEVKAFETKDVIEKGATEVDMVINVGKLKERDLEYVKNDIKAVVEAAKGKALTKVIIETCLLTDEEKVIACQLSKEAGADFSNVVKTTVFIKDMNEFAQINEVYAEYFGENKPARACVEVARLPKDVKVEIELIAVL